MSDNKTANEQALESLGLGLASISEEDPATDYKDGIFSEAKDGIFSESGKLGFRPAKNTDVKLRFDPVELVRQVQRLREEGMDETMIRAAFEAVLSENRGDERQAKSVMKRHLGSIPMPTQDEINKLYEDRHKNDISERADIIEILTNTHPKGLFSQKLEESLKPSLKNRIVRYLAIRVLKGLIFVCKALGVN